MGLPFEILGKLYNVAAVFSHGEVLGLVPKSYLPNYNEFYEARHFVSGAELATEVVLPDGSCVPADRDLLFVCEQMPKLRIGVELCEDLWTPNPPSISHALAGASVLVNLSASNELTGKDSYRRELVSGQSARLLAHIFMRQRERESLHRIWCSPGTTSLRKTDRFLRNPSVLDMASCIRRLMWNVSVHSAAE